MEMYNAAIETRGEDKYLVLMLADESLEIPLTEDEPIKVKSVFNRLVESLKNGAFNFEFQDNGSDLFVQVSKEYITQLNLELVAVYEEMEHFDLLNSDV